MKNFRDLLTKDDLAFFKNIFTRFPQFIAGSRSRPLAHEVPLASCPIFSWDYNNTCSSAVYTYLGKNSRVKSLNHLFFRRFRFTFANPNELLTSKPELSVKEKQKAVNTICGTTASSDYFSGAVLVADNSQVIYRKSFGLANRKWEISNSIETKFHLGW